jgi:hypothetical protein
MKISILTPTRGRPQRLTTFIKSLDETASGIHDIEVVLGIDEDDQESIDFNISTKTINLIKTVAPRDTMGSINTRCYNKSTGDLIILTNDDIIVKTQGWDQIIINETSVHHDKIFLGFPHDGHKSKMLSTFPILSRECINLIGNAFPTQYKGSLIDLHIFEIFLRLKKIAENRIIPLHNVYFEHNHFQKDPTLLDKTYLERDRFGDDLTYMGLREERVAQADKLTTLLNTSPLIVYKNLSLDVINEKEKKYFRYFLKIISDVQLPNKYKITHLLHFTARKIFSTVISK